MLFVLIKPPWNTERSTHCRLVVVCLAALIVLSSFTVASLKQMQNQVEMVASNCFRVTMLDGSARLTTKMSIHVSIFRTKLALVHFQGSPNEAAPLRSS